RTRPLFPAVLTVGARDALEFCSLLRGGCDQRGDALPHLGHGSERGHPSQGGDPAQPAAALLAVKAFRGLLEIVATLAQFGLQLGIGREPPCRFYQPPPTAGLVPHRRAVVGRRAQVLAKSLVLRELQPELGYPQRLLFDALFLPSKHRLAPSCLRRTGAGQRARTLLLRDP